MKTLKLSGFFLSRLSQVEPRLRTLHYLGEDEQTLFGLPRVAIVGSRKATPYGLSVTEKLAGELARQGIVIVSGLAYGIDIAAHKAALSIGGRTVAVLPSGLHAVYPAAHQRIAEDICREGMLVSEYPENYQPRKVEFLERNRLIAAFSDLVIVIEATERSGSLNTVAHARTMGIPIAAVPGPITSTNSRGTNDLLKQGATLISRYEDVLELLHVENDAHTPVRSVSYPQMQAILDALSNGPLETTMLALKSNLDTKVLLTLLTSLELSGDIEQNAIGLWQLR